MAIEQTKKKASFLDSTVSGMFGYAKGMLTGAGIGVVLGAAAGVAISIATGGFGLAAIGGAALLGAQLTAIPMGLIGAFSGTVTAVVQNREAARPSTAELVEIAKTSYSQGVSAGKELAQEQNIEGQDGKEGTKWRDRNVEEKVAKALAGHTIH